MTPRGSVVVDERILPITDITLAAGMVRIVAQVTGPTSAASAANYRVHDRAGELVYRSVGGQEGRLSWPEIPDKITMDVVIEIAFEGKMSTAREPV